MNNKTKIILTIIGLGAIVVPAILLVVFSANKNTPQTTVPAGNRQIDQTNIQKEAQPAAGQTFVASPSPVVVTPSPAAKTPSPKLESTPSGGN